MSRKTTIRLDFRLAHHMAREHDRRKKGRRIIQDNGWDGDWWDDYDEDLMYVMDESEWGNWGDQD